MRFRAVSCWLVLSALTLGACTGLDKSENALSPTLAGPIPGVFISPPAPLDPKDGRSIEFASQPITLTLQNAESSGPRPLAYTFEIATDTGFSSLLFARDGVAPGQDGRTSLRLPDALGTGRTYFWRARARDGANDGPYSGLAHFSIFTPIVIDKPIPRVPVGNVLLDSASPRFTIGNAARSGPVGAMRYIVEVAGSDSFADRYVIWTIGEQAGQTSFDAPSPLPNGKQLFWRARGFDGGNEGPWSDAQVFRTPAPAPLQPSPGGGGGTGTGGHIAAGPPTEDRAKLVIFGTYDEFPSLSVIFGSTEAAEDAAEQLLLRTIWHLQLAGFQAGRQQNPSGAISKDKLTINIGGWHAYDIYSLGTAGKKTTVQFFEVGSPVYVAHPGIKD